MFYHFLKSFRNYRNIHALQNSSQFINCNSTTFYPTENLQGILECCKNIINKKLILPWDSTVFLGGSNFVSVAYQDTITLHRLGFSENLPASRHLPNSDHIPSIKFNLCYYHYWYNISNDGWYLLNAIYMPSIVLKATGIVLKAMYGLSHYTIFTA